VGDDAGLPQRDDGEAVADPQESGFLEDITQAYLHEIGATPLLTAAEEARLARAARDGALSGTAEALHQRCARVA
jgi:DNA-directed RNA polymerase sigma subunit (sigma70/sigma32)